jgi:hypothetical protein
MGCPPVGVALSWHAPSWAPPLAGSGQEGFAQLKVALPSLADLDRHDMEGGLR